MRVALILASIWWTIQAHGQTPVFETIYGEPVYEKALAIDELYGNSIYVHGFADIDSIGDVDFSLSKLDATGTHLWTRYLGTALDDYLGYGVPNVDSTGFYLVGSSLDTSGISYGRIIHTDTNGIELFSEVGGFTTGNNAFNHVQVTTDSGAVACGQTPGVTGTGLDYLISKFDQFGNLEWQRRYGGADNDYAQAIRQLADGGYIVVGDSKSFNPGGNYDIWLLRLDANGDSLWSSVHGGLNEVNGCQDILALTDGTHLIVGESTVPPATWFDFTLIKVDDSGVEQWSQIYGGAGADAAFSVVERAPGDLMITGYSNTNSGGSAPTDLVFLATNANGVEKGRAYFGGSGIDIGYDIKETTSGDFIACGMSNNGVDDDNYVIRIAWDEIVGIMESIDQQDLTCYPNPATDHLMIVGDFISYELYSVDGQLVGSGTHSPIDTHQLDSGMYLIAIHQVTGTQTRTIIVQ